MSIFGKKPSGHGIPEEGQKPNLEVPNFEKYVYQSSTSGTKSPQAPAREAPQVQKAPPPSMTQAPTMTQAPSMTQAPTMTQAPSMTQPPQARTQHPQANPLAQSPYSIDDVIRLMRELPDSKKEMVVIIVQKTLLSAKIDVGAIIDDAARKVDKLSRGNDRLISEIRELEEAIIQKKAEVERVNKELDETNSVKQIFEATYGRHVKGEGEVSNPTTPQLKIF